MILLYVLLNVIYYLEREDNSTTFYIVFIFIPMAIICAQIKLIIQVIYPSQMKKLDLELADELMEGTDVTQSYDL